MPDAPYALAVSAGILAAVNPCGFAMLPAYVPLLITADLTTSFAGTVPKLLATQLFEECGDVGSDVVADQFERMSGRAASSSGPIPLAYVACTSRSRPAPTNGAAV